jgi:hypothetical protein
MSAGVLQFSLGLTTGGFLGALDKTLGKVAAFTGGLTAMAQPLIAAIERGGELNDLSARTGESVDSLYRLQEAFKVVGISTEALPGMINRFNKSLSGVGEMGENTKEAFAALGLSVDDLKKLDAPGQIGAVVKQLGKLDKTSAMDVASRIFGREGAGNIMQISRDAAAFNQTMKDSAREAAVFKRNAEAFDKLGDTITRVKGQLSGMFAGIAEGVVPAIQMIADALSKIDLVSIGQEIGKVLTAFTQAFREGTLIDLIAEVIKTGLKIGWGSLFTIVPAIFAKIGYALLKVFETPLLYFQSGLEWAIQKAMQGIGKIPGIGKATGLSGFQAEDFGSIYAQRKEEGLKFNVGFGEFGMSDIKDSSNQFMAEGLRNIKAISQPLMSMFDGLVSRAPKGEQARKREKPGSEPPLLDQKYKFESTAFEKMGFVMGGQGNPMKRTEDLLQLIVRNTAKINSGPIAQTNIL